MVDLSRNVSGKVNELEMFTARVDLIWFPHTFVSLNAAHAYCACVRVPLAPVLHATYLVLLDTHRVTRNQV